MTDEMDAMTAMAARMKVYAGAIAWISHSTPKEVQDFLADREALKARADHAESFCYRASKVAGTGDFLCAEVVPLRARLAELERERDEARRHLGFSEAIENQIEHLAKVMAESDGFIWATDPYCSDYGFVDSYTAGKFRKYARAVLSEITAAMAEQPKAEVKT